MATDRLNKKEKQQLLDLLKRAQGEIFEDFESYVQGEVLQNSPELHDYVKSLGKDGLPPHARFGINPHPLACGRCQRPTGLSVPLFERNTIWTCPSCHTSMYQTDDAFPKCTCGTEMEHIKNLEREEVINFDYMCGGCRRNKDEQVKIEKEGGAILRCTECHTLGTLPKTHKMVKEFRQKYVVPKEATLGFTLDETQCPRCADMKLQRAFTDKELEGILVVQEDINEVAQHFNLKGKRGRKVPAKKGKKDVKALDKLAKEKADAFIDKVESEDGAHVRHPGTKTAH